ncbi:MAG: hypothetical protein H6622_15900 [Halobacteriovoraceae bacterium]|nr:hypothetical protein [Halobacteriovoraceae bacterium]
MLLEPLTKTKNIAYKEWNISKSTELLIKENFSEDFEDELQYKLLFDFLVKERNLDMGPWGQRFMKKVIQEALETDSEFMKNIGIKTLNDFNGPFYDQLKNRVAINGEGEGVERLNAAIHELEHAFDRNSNFKRFFFYDIFNILNALSFIKMPIASILHTRIESQAIGAQWEFVSRIPQTHRQKLIEKYTYELTNLNQFQSTKITDDRSIRELLIFSLMNAGLSKSDYIDRMLVYQGHYFEMIISTHLENGFGLLDIPNLLLYLVLFLHL